MSNYDVISCFLSHKCNAIAHAFGIQLETALKGVQVVLLRDPFETGHDIPTRIRTVTFHSFVYLHSAESWASPFCQEELTTARARSVPILTVRLSDEVPQELKRRLCVNVEGLTSPEIDAMLIGLAATIRDRGRLFKTIDLLSPQNHPDLIVEAARRLAEDVDRTLVAESLGLIGPLYRPEISPEARFWLALAVGRAGTCEAAETLKRFSWENHPYPQEGLRQAKQMLSPLRW